MNKRQLTRVNVEGKLVSVRAKLHSRSAQATEIDLATWRGRVPFELLGRTNFPPIGEGPYLVTLGPYGFFWFLLREPDASTIEVPRIWAEFETLVVTDGWRSLLCGRSKSVLEHDVLLAFLASRRWYAERGNPLTTHIVGVMPIAAADPDLGVALLEAKGKRETANYLLPLTIKWTRLDRERQHPSALAAVRRGPREGSLLDATADPGFVALVLENLRAARTIEADQRRIEFAPTVSFPKDVLVAIEDVRAVDTEQSNTTVLVGTDYVVKLFRRLEPGLNPEIEVGHFLTETVAFPHAPPPGR